MKLGLKEILVGATLTTVGCDKPQLPLRPIEECRVRALAVVKHINDYADATGTRIGSWDSAVGKEWQACLGEKKLPPDSRLVQ